jgi:hypothetical protein
MIHLQQGDRLFISEDLIGFSDEFVRKGIMGRRVDLMFLGFSYAVKNGMPPTDDFRRHQLIQVALIDADTMLTIETVAQWYTKEIGHGEITEQPKLLEFICSLGITGVRALQERWQNKSKSQIQFDIAGLS